MAKITDGEISFEIIPEVNINGWINYAFNFLWNDKPIFNPEIMRDRPMGGEDIHAEYLVDLFEEAAKCEEDGKIFSWASIEPESEIRIKANINERIDENKKKLAPLVCFDVEVFFNEVYFERKNKEDNGSYGVNYGGIRINFYKDELIEFSKRLREEYKVSLNKAKKANPDFKLGF